MTLMTRDGIVLQSIYTSDYMGFNNFHFDILAAGSYVVTVQNYYPKNDTKDFTLRYYAP